MRKLQYSLTALLLAGAIFAGYNVTKNFIRFYHFEGTLFKFKNCVVPNPATEACFYGAIAFIVALAWSIMILRSQADHIRKLQHYLWWFLGAGTIFAWYNVSKEFIQFYITRPGAALGCSATPITNPFLTPCFAGACIFFLSTILAGLIYSKMANRASLSDKVL